MPSTEKFFEISPKNEEYDFNPESFAVNGWIFTPLAYKKLLATF